MTRYGTDPLSGILFTFGQRLRSSQHMNLILPWLRGLDAAAQLMSITNLPWSFKAVSTSDELRASTYYTSTDQWIVVGSDVATGSGSALWAFHHPGHSPTVQHPTDIGSLSCVASSGSVVVAGTSDTGSTAQKILTSATGTSWTARNLSGATTEAVRDICWDSTNSLFVAVLSGDKIETSPTGTTWTARTTGGSGLDFNGVSTNGSIIVATATGTSFDTSTDGVTWTSRTVPGGTYTRAAYHTVWGKWFAATSSTVIESSDGATWASGSATSPGGLCNMVEFGDYMVASVVESGTIAVYASSDECVSWTRIVVPTTTTGAIFNVVSSGEQLCICADDECHFSLRAPTSL
jgi:hypothetical protein